MVGARRLHQRLAEADMGEFRVVLLPEPDINIVCYVVTHPGADSLARLNDLNEGIYERMSLTRPGAAPDYIITRTRFQTPMYDGAVDPLLEALRIRDQEWRDSGAAGLVVLRSTVMDPFLADPPPAPDHVSGFIRTLRETARDAARDALTG